MAASMTSFNDLIEAIEGQYLMYNGNLGIIRGSAWAVSSDVFEIRCVSIFDPRKYFLLQFGGHYIGQMKSPNEFYDMLFKQTPPDILNNKLLQLVLD